MKIYAYLDETMVRAVRADGVHVASITADGSTEDQQKDIGMAVMLAGAPTEDLVWVESPQDHPVLREIVQRQEVLPGAERTDEREPEGPSAEQLDEEAKMHALRAELHICPTCSCASVCQISHAVNACPDAFVTVSACLTYTPKEENL